MPPLTAPTDSGRSLWMALLLPAVLLLVLVLVDQTAGRLAFHSLAELFCVIVAVLTFIVAWHARSLLRNDFLLFLAIGYLWVGLLDGLHLLSVPGIGMFPVRDAEITLHLWIYTRLFQALVLLAAFHFLRHPLPAVPVLLGGGLLAALIALLAIGLEWPPMLTASGLTLHKLVAEAVIMVLLAVVLLRLVRQREELPAILFHALWVSVLLLLAAELSFTLYVDFGSLAFLVGHLLKFLAYWVIFTALVETSLKKPFALLSRASRSYDAIPHPALMVNGEGRMLQANRAAADMAGVSLPDLVGEPVHDHFHAPDLDPADCELCRAIAEQRPMQGYIVYRQKEDSWYQLSLAPLSPDDPSMGMVQTLLDVSVQIRISRDLTETLRNSRQVEKALRESEERFRNLFEHTDAIPVQGYDEQRRIIYWNPASEKLFGYRRDQAMGRLLEELILTPELAQRFAEGVQRWLEQGVPLESGERELVNFRGDPVPVFVSHVMLEKADGQREMYCIDIDLGESKRIERQVRTLSQAVEQSPVAVMLTDTRRCIEYVNSAFEEITGYAAEDVIGRDPSILESPTTPPERYAELWRELREGRSWKGELESRRKNGERYWEYAYYAPVMDDSGEIRHYLAVSEDITLRKEQQQRILHQAHFDALTDLPNRFLSLDRLDHAIREARRGGECVALLFLDLDDFKKINDSLGHEVGDRVLVEAATRLRASVRSGDTVGRLGGDEFVVILGGLKDASDALPVVEGLMGRLREPYRLDGRELVMSVSIGISAYPQDGSDVSELLRKADSAMYHAKGQGRNAFSFFTEDMNREVSYRLSLEEQIHGALDRNEFSVVYQPKVAVATGAIIGAEALLRWHNPRLGQVAPDEFIPVAEQTGVIVPLGQFVLQEALAMAARQRRQRPDFHVAVNLSPRQFRDHNLVAEIDAALRRNGLPSQALELEITEGVLMSGHAHIDQALLQLTELGVRIAMDDFGTGYSSLSYLREYPFDVLKIDRSFVRDIGKDAADRELISASIAMAHGLGLEVVAEGVETEEQRAFLHSLRCDWAQGYLFGRPRKEGRFGV